MKATAVWPAFNWKQSNLLWWLKTPRVDPFVEVCRDIGLTNLREQVVPLAARLQPGGLLTEPFGPHRKAVLKRYGWLDVPPLHTPLPFSTC